MTNHQNKDQSDIPDFLAEFLAQPGTFSNDRKLKDWLKANPENQILFDECLDLWQASIKARSPEYYNENEAWIRIQNLLKKSKQEAGKYLHPGTGLTLFKRIAAAMILAFIIGLGLFTYKYYSTPLEYSEFSVPYGSKSHMLLPDGSSVWLNAGSKLRYNSNFGVKNRNVYLEGEGFFNVIKTKTSFFVRTRAITVEVLGTAFNVKAYPDEETIETTVEKGVVKIENNTPTASAFEKIIIKANQKAVYKVQGESANKATSIHEEVTKKPDNEIPEIKGEDAKQNIVIIKHIVPEIYTSWKDEKWIIEREELKDLTKKLERRYNIRIIFKDESIKSYVFSGILRDETLEQVLEYIKLTAPIGFNIQQNQVSLYEVNSLKSQLKRK